MDGFTGRIVAAKAEADIGNTAADLGIGQVGLDPACGFDEIDGIVVMLFDTGGDGEDIGVENDVFRREADGIDQQIVGAFANGDLSLVSVCLSLFVECHDDDGRTIPAAQFRLSEKFGFTGFQRNGIDDGFALEAFQASLDHFPFGRIQHDRNSCDFRFRCDQVQKTPHGADRIQHGFVHVDIDDLGTVFDLLTRDCQCLVVFLVQNHPGESLRTRDVRAFADIDEQGIIVDREGFQTGQAHCRRDDRYLSGRQRGNGLRDGADMVRRRAATASDHIDETAACKLVQERCRIVWTFIETGFTHRIGQAGIRINTDMRVGDS